MESVDDVLRNIFQWPCHAHWFVFENNEAVIRMMFKGRSLTLRHVV